MRKKPHLVILLLCFVPFISRGQNPILYGVIGDTLVTVDTQTGTATSVGHIGNSLGRVGDMIWHPPTNQLLAIANFDFNPLLISLDRITGTATVIGPLDMTGPFLNLRLGEGMAYDDVTGQVYFAGYEQNSTTANWFYSRRFGTVDVSNGQVQQTASVSGTCQDDIDGMEFLNGTLFTVDGCPNPQQFYSFNLATGNATFIGNINANSVADMAVHPLTNVMYTTDHVQRQLGILNPNNGQYSMVGPTHNASQFGGSTMIAMAFAPEPVQSLNLTAQSSNPNCAGGTDGSIELNATGGVPPYLYSFNGGTYGPNNVFNGLSAGNYTVSVQDAAGNDTSFVVTVVEPPSLFMSFNLASPLCNGDNTGSIEVLAGGGTPGYTYSLDGITFIANPVFSGIPGGNYTVYVQDQNGCTTSVQTSLMEPSPLTGTVFPTAVTCNGIGDAEAVLMASGGVPPYTYSSDGITFSSNSTLTGLSAGPHIAYLMDANGCGLSIPFSVSASGGIELSLDVLDLAVCPGEGSDLLVSASNGNPPYSYNLGTGNQSSGNFPNLPPGNYSVTATDQQGCMDTLQINVPTVAPLDPAFSISESTCEFPAPFDFVPDQSWIAFSWNFGDGNTSNQSNPNHSYNAPGNYTVSLTVENADGCLATVSSNLLIAPLPVAGFQSEPALPTQILNGDVVAFQNTSQHTTAWAWDFGDGYLSQQPNPVHTFEEPGVYCISMTATNENGCIDSTSACSVTVLGDQLFVPSAFSPNGDGLNDAFEMAATFVPTDFSLLIFNRWGALVFETQTWGDFWKGGFKGDAVPEGVYVWRLSYEHPLGLSGKRQGTITVIR